MPNHSRRGFLKATLGAAWTGAALLEQAFLRAQHARALAPPKGPKLFDIEKVADGVYAAIARPQVLLNCNAAIFENANDLLVVDTHSKPSAVVGLVAQIRAEITSKPVRYIVNSHFHWDHTQGTPAYRKLHPQADVVSSETTRALLSEHAAARLKGSLESTARSVDEYKRKLAAAQTAEEKQAYGALARDAEAYLAEMRSYQPELPNITFDRDLIIRDRSHDLHLAFRGRAHTAGDVMVWCPQKKVIATGDVLHGFAPYIADGYPRQWPATLRQLAEFDFTHVIGGHAGVQPGKQRLHEKAAYLEELSEQVAHGKRAGKTSDQLQAELTPANLRSLQGSYRDYLAQAMRYLALEPGTTPERFVAGAVKSNVADVYRTIDKS